ncbi:30S ribosomal protein S21 [Rhizobium leucaenae]|uniref:30S ribosomal protein S21 n=1 Tax=Rhizobium leucaenae TaxID=29450 RepID=UPI00040E6FC1|nr:30S ribosomal protein S21 [Rhizobium leucaenae]
MQVIVWENNIEQALRILKKKLQREGVFREMRARRSYEKPSEKRVREEAQAIRRHRKLARKKLQREGLLPAPKKVARAR